jgi:hypothetical protein
LAAFGDLREVGKAASPWKCAYFGGWAEGKKRDSIIRHDAGPGIVVGRERFGSPGHGLGTGSDQRERPVTSSKNVNAPFAHTARGALPS